MKADVKTLEAKASGSVDLDEAVFGVKPGLTFFSAW